SGDPPLPTPTHFPYTTLFRSYTPESPPPISNRRGRLPARYRHSPSIFTSRSGVSCQNTPISTKVSAAHGSIGQGWIGSVMPRSRSEEHTSELQSPDHLVCRLL